jgi:hypothetical protein
VVVPFERSHAISSASFVSEDALLKTLAASRIARGGSNRVHAISYNPSVVKEPDYLICYQCGFIVRLFYTATGSL